jgi:Tol biopolymer transport system component
MGACRLVVAVLLVLDGCSRPARSPRAASTPTAATAPAPVPPQPPPDPNVAAEVNHGAPLPAATDGRERVVFWRAGSIWSMRPDGTAPEQVTVRPLDAPDASPAFAPRGDAIAYASLSDGVYRIWVMSLADRLPRAVTDGGGVGDTEPAWSPDGRKLAFMRGDPRDSVDLYLVDVPATDSAPAARPTLLLAGDDDDPERVGAPAFAPDGASIVLSADRRQGKGTGLFRFDLARRSLTRISPVPRKASHILDLDPAFSPDGTRIAFASNRHVASADHDDLDIYSMAVDGSGLTRLTDDPGSAREPAYSPDGKRIFFASTRYRQNAYEWEIYVMSATGGRTVRLTRDERPQNRAPSPGRAQ